MQLQTSTATPNQPTALADASIDLEDQDYWHGLINEREAGQFLGVGARNMQRLRQDGGGPRYHRLSVRCLRYTRAELKAWADARLVASTAEYPDATGEAA